MSPTSPDTCFGDAPQCLNCSHHHALLVLGHLYPQSDPLYKTYVLNFVESVNNIPLLPIKHLVALAAYSGSLSCYMTSTSSMSDRWGIMFWIMSWSFFPFTFHHSGTGWSFSHLSITVIFKTLHVQSVTWPDPIALAVCCCKLSLIISWVFMKYRFRHHWIRLPPHQILFMWGLKLHLVTARCNCYVAN